MKRLKLFPKTFLYTLGLMLFITGIAHALLYFLMPSITVSLANDNTGQYSVSLNYAKLIADTIGTLLPYSLLICLVVSIICSFFYSKAITQPIKHISAETLRMAALDQNAQCNIRSGDEIGALADNINGLYRNLLSTIKSLEDEIEKVSESEKSKVDFLRAASHELKTPVTALHAILENMILGVGKYNNHEDYLPKCQALAEQLGIMIKEILDTTKINIMAEADECININLADVVVSLCEPYQIIARAKGINFHVDISDGFVVTLSPKMFSKAVSNIIVNAVAYTEKGKTIRIYTENQSLIIENECHPIPPEHLSHLFEPFYRPEYARDRDSGGNGLGLYIVDTIFKALKISYEFTPMHNQEGMRFCIRF